MHSRATKIVLRKYFVTIRVAKGHVCLNIYFLQLAKKVNGTTVCLPRDFICREVEHCKKDLTLGLHDLVQLF